MQYLISAIDPIKNSGGNKAKKDIDFFASQLNDTGVIHVKIYYTRLQRYLLTRLSIIRLVKTHPADRYILQFPISTPYVLRQFIEVIHKYTNAKIDLFIHDLPVLQLSMEDKERELVLFNQVDNLIVHNQAMKKWLTENDVKTNMIELGLFDYDNEQPMQKKQEYDPANFTICFPGNLAKSTFLTKVNLSYRLNIYGPNRLDSYPEGIRYCGQYTPEELPKHLTEDFGLIWDGNSIETCSGTFGEYLKYNNPHKTSLYLSTGIPVIIWDQAALAPLIKESGAGICISSLTELDNVLLSLTNEQYQLMKRNAEKLGKKLREGYYTKHALTKLNMNE